MTRRDITLLAAGVILIISAPLAGWNAYRAHQEVLLSALPQFTAGVLLIWLSLDRKGR